MYKTLAVLAVLTLSALPGMGIASGKGGGGGGGGGGKSGGGFGGGKGIPLSIKSPAFPRR